LEGVTGTGRWHLGHETVVTGWWQLGGGNSGDTVVAPWEGWQGLGGDSWRVRGTGWWHLGGDGGYRRVAPAGGH